MITIDNTSHPFLLQIAFVLQSIAAHVFHVDPHQDGAQFNIDTIAMRKYVSRTKLMSTK
jgi:hypothetical protein